MRDLFFNIPARKKFLKAESTELSHIASLVTHYALAHPDKHFELHSATNAMLVAPPVAGYSERVYQVFGKEVSRPIDSGGGAAAAGAHRAAAASALAPRRKSTKSQDEEICEPKRILGEMRVHGFVSKPEIQKLNRNSIYRFRQRTPDSRPPDPARAHRGLPQHHAADGVSRWCCCSSNCRAARWT